MTTALVGTLLLTAVGASMDGGRMITTKMQLQSVSDAAALMAATPENISPRERHALALSSVQSHAAERSDLVLQTPDIAVRNGGKAVDVGLTAEVPMLFGAFLGGSTRYVSVSSTAEETTTSSMSAISISVILDLSESMSERFDTGSRINAVKSAVGDTFRSIQNQFGGEAASETMFSSGLYPFNWGLVYDETVSLAPGSANVMSEIVFTSTKEGSVPTTAWELALQEQQDAIASEGQRDRFIIYLTDGNVDDDKGDVSGREIRDADMYENGNTGACRNALRKYDDAYEELVESYNHHQDVLSRNDENDGGNPDAVFASVGDHLALYGNDDHRNGNNADSPMVKRIKKAYSNVQKWDEKVIKKCKPVQTTRVIEACEKAREDDISIIAVDLSGSDGEVRQTTDLCVGAWSGEPEETNSRGGQNTENVIDNKNRQTLPGGLTVTVSDDGKSMSASVSNLKELREVLATMLPEAGKAERAVRLVN